MDHNQVPLHGLDEQPREPISAFVIAYNEEEQIGDCLKSLDFCDEVVVLDSFSTDRTLEICKQHGARVVQREWPGYCEQKRFGLSLVTHEWVINLDADERISPRLREEILAVLRKEHEAAGQASDERISGYFINRVVHYLGRWWRRGGWYPEYRARFFRKSKVVWVGVDPHEKPVVQGKTGRLGGEIQHFTYKDMRDQLQRLQEFAWISAAEEFERGGRVHCWRLLANPLLRFIKFYVFKLGIREGVAGFIVAVHEAHYTFMKYARLWELEFIQAEEARNQEAKNKEVHGD